LQSFAQQVTAASAGGVVVLDTLGRVLYLNILRQLYGLSPAEAKLALCLLRGNSVAESAEVLGVTVHTART
jgi:DNA-binding CsgD family transcriptional regulator